MPMETRRFAAVGLLLLFVLAPLGPTVQVELPEPLVSARSGGAPAVDEVPTWRVGDTWVYETGFDVANLIANAGVSASVSTLEGDTTMEVASVGLMTMNDASGTSVVGYTMDIDGAFTSGNSGATLQGTSGRLDITYTGRDTVRASDMAMITSEFDLLVEFAPFNFGFLAFELADLTFTTTYDPPQESRDHPVRTGDNWSQTYTAETTVTGTSDNFDPSDFDTTNEENTTWAVTGSGAPTAQDGFSVAYGGCGDAWKINRWNSTGADLGFEWYCPAVRGPAWIRVQQAAGFQIDWTLKTYEPASSYGVVADGDPGERCTDLALSAPFPAYLPNSTVDLTVEYVVTPAAYAACSSADIARYPSAYTEYLAGNDIGSMTFQMSSSAGSTESRWPGVNCCSFTVPSTTDGTPSTDDHSSDGIVVFDSQQGVVGVYTVVVDLDIVGVDLMPLVDGVLVNRTRDGVTTRLGPDDVIGGVVGDTLEFTIPIANRGILDVTGSSAVAEARWDGGSTNLSPSMGYPPIGGYGQTSLTLTVPLTSDDRAAADPAVVVEVDVAAVGATDANTSNDVARIPVFVGTLPTASLSIDPNKKTGEPVLLDASGSMDDDGGTVACLFDIETPAGMMFDVEAEGCSLEYVWDDDGAWDVTVKVLDEEGDTAMLTSSAVILNRPPQVNISSSTSVVARSSVTVLVTDANDPDTVSPPALAITYAWSGVRCDEGGATDQCTFAPEDEGVTTVLLTATDDDGATTNVSVDVLATNLAPSLDPVRFIMNGTEVPPEDGWVLDEDQAVNLMVAVDDTPSDLSQLGVNWDLSDRMDGFTQGTVGPISNVQVSWPIAGVHRVEVEAVDNDGVRSTPRYVDITVRNVAPTITGLDPTVAVYEDDLLSLNVKVDDTASDLLNLTVCWDLDALVDVDDDGDGRNDCDVEGVSLEHVWAAQGTHTVTATVTDDDGAFDRISTNVTVVNLRPTAVITASVNVSELVEGDGLNLSSSASLDTPSDLPSLRSTWDLPLALGSTPVEGETVVLTSLPAGTWLVNLTVVDDNGASHMVSLSLTVAEAPPGNVFQRAAESIGVGQNLIIGALLLLIGGLGATLLFGGRSPSPTVDKGTSMWETAPPQDPYVAAFTSLPAAQPAPPTDPDLTPFLEAGTAPAPAPALQPDPSPVPSPAPATAGPPLPASGLPPGWSMEQWAFYGERWLEANAPPTPTMAQQDLAGLLDDLGL